MTTLLLSIARAILLLCTTCKRFIISPQNSLLIMFHLVVIVLFFLYRINSKHAVQTPLLSFPSLSKPLVSFASISLAQPLSSFRSIPRPLVSLPSISLQAIFSTPPFKKDSVLTDRVVPSAPPEPDRNIYAGEETPDEEESMSMEDTWKAIVASSGATPVKLKHSDEQDSTLERVVQRAKVKNSAIRRKKKERRAQKIEENTEGWRQRDALVIVPRDDLSQHADAFIKKHNDNLKLQKRNLNNVNL